MTNMKIEEHEFQELLARAIDREKQAYRRATYLTAIPILVGLILFSFFTYRAIKLRREALSLDAQIQDKTRQLEDLSKKLEKTKADVAETADELSTAQDTVEKIRVDLEKIKAGEVNPRREAAETLKEIGTAGPWAVAVAADKNLESARTTAAKAQELGNGQILICQREGWWRIVAVFSSKSEADANVRRIRMTFPEGDSAVRDMNKWCPGRADTEPGMCKCPN